METRTCPAYGCRNGKTSTGTCMVCRGQGLVRVRDRDLSAGPSECPYHACGNTCGGKGFYDYGGAKIYCWVAGPATDVPQGNLAKSAERMEEFLDLERKFRTAMLQVTSARAGGHLLDLLEELDRKYQRLLDTTTPDDLLMSANVTALRERLADITDWRARAFENDHRYAEAIAEFDRAAGLYEKLGKVAAAQRTRDKASELRLSTTGDVDVELQRLRESLKNTPSGTLDRVKVLLAIGELYSASNDDFEAVKYLHEAEQELERVGGHPADAAILSALADTMARISLGEEVGGASPVEGALLRRALTQRLLLALGNAYRITDPARAAQYEDRLRQLDGGRQDSNLRELLGQFLDAGQDIQKFLNRGGKGA